MPSMLIFASAPGTKAMPHTGLHKHQLGLKMLDFGDDPYSHTQHIKQVEDMAAAARTTLGMSDDNILTVKIGRMEIGSAGKTMGFRQRGQPLLGPYGIVDDRRALDWRQHQAKVDPAAL